MASPGKKAFLLRLDPKVWEAIEALATQELRSVNAQVEWMLREGLARRGRHPGSDPSPARGQTPLRPRGAERP